MYLGSKQTFECLVVFCRGGWVAAGAEKRGLGEAKLFGGVLFG